MHLLIATAEDIENPNAWSGIPYNLLKVVKPSFQRLSIVRYARPSRNITDTIPRIVLGRALYPLWMTDRTLKECGSHLKESIETLRPDRILSISSQGLCYYQPEIPTFMFSDAPWMSWKQAYRDFETMPIRAKKYAALESRAVQNLDGLIFASKWASREARRLYGRDSHVVPLGANWFPSIDDDALSEHVKARGNGPMRLLFVGRDWERKGGPQALEITRALHRAEMPVRLHIVGCEPNIPRDTAELVHIHGFMDKNAIEDSHALEKIFLTSDFFLTPTRADCFGIAFAEANAFALPSICYSVNAIPEIIEDNINGILFQMSENSVLIAKNILDIYKNRSLYEFMCANARRKFLESYNWETFGRRLSEIIINQ